jgi:acetyl-CoA acyltransferase
MSTMRGREVVVVEAVRTPIGRGHKEKGIYSGVHPSKLLALTLEELFKRASIDPAVVDDVLGGCVMSYGEQSYNITRTAWLLANLPETVPAVTMDRQCGSAQQAFNYGAATIASGVNDVVVATGVEHMGHNPLTNPFADPVAWTQELRDLRDVRLQDDAAEMIADEYGVTREEMDEFSAESHRRAAAATEEGRFKREIVAMTTPEGAVLEQDQGIRPGTTVDVLAKLRPAFKEGGRITAGNASQISDGAAALMLMTRDKAAELGLEPRARVVDQVAVGVSPVSMLRGPIPATEKLLERNSMTIDDIDLFEINEAFASVTLGWSRAVGGDLAKTNVNGGAIALGHPVGATGARLLTTLLHELERADKTTGLVAMCCGGGIGTGTLIERI